MCDNHQRVTSFSVFPTLHPFLWYLHLWYHLRGLHKLLVTFHFVLRHKDMGQVWTHSNLRMTFHVKVAETRLSVLLPIHKLPFLVWKDHLGKVSSILLSQVVDESRCLFVLDHRTRMRFLYPPPKFSISLMHKWKGSYVLFLFAMLVNPFVSFLTPDLANQPTLILLWGFLSYHRDHYFSSIPIPILLWWCGLLGHLWFCTKKLLYFQSMNSIPFSWLLRIAFYQPVIVF